MKKNILAAMAALVMLTASAAQAETAASPVKPINLNTASREELIALPGIGEAKADAIIAQRQEKPFQREEDLLIVKGIGDKMMEKIAPYVEVTGQTVSKNGN